MKALLILSLLFSVAAEASVSVPRAKQYAWFDYDVSRDGGQSVAHPLNLDLPAQAVLTGVYVYINTQFAASGTESIGISCVGSQDVMAYAPMAALLKDRMYAGLISASTFNGSAAPIPNGASALNLSQGYGSVPSDCRVSVDVRGASGYTPYTAGKMTGVIEFFRL